MKTIAVVLALSCLAVSAHAQAPACEPGTHLAAQTPRLGMQFIQGGAPVSFCLADKSDEKTYTVIAAVHLKRAPFEIRVPKSNWPKRADETSMSVAVSDQPGFEKLLQFGAADEATPFFGIFRAMADTPFGSGSFATAEGELPVTPKTDYGYNYLNKDRFGTSGADYQGVLISRIERRYGDDDLMKANAPVTLVFYIDKGYGLRPKVRDQYGEHDVIDVNEVDIVRATFVD